MIIRQDVRPNKMIWVTFRKEGMHKYPAAATDSNLATGDEYVANGEIICAALALGYKMRRPKHKTANAYFNIKNL